MLEIIEFFFLFSQFIFTHLHYVSLVATFLIESDVLFGAVKNNFIAFIWETDFSENLYDSQADILSSGCLGNDNILDVSSDTGISQELLFVENGSSSYDLARLLVFDHDDFVRVAFFWIHLVKSLQKHIFFIFAAFCESCKDQRESFRVVVSAEESELHLRIALTVQYFLLQWWGVLSWTACIGFHILSHLRYIQRNWLQPILEVASLTRIVFTQLVLKNHDHRIFLRWVCGDDRILTL